MKYLLFIFLVVALLLAGCVSENNKNVAIPAQTSTSTIITLTPAITLCEKKCNDLCYDPSKQSCCFGTILDGNWREESSDGSCENLNFKSTALVYQEWYCGGQTYHANEDIGCCNGTIYNDNTQYCNNGGIYQGIQTVNTIQTVNAIQTVNTTITRSNYPHFLRVDQIQGKWRSSYSRGIFFVTIKNDGEQHVSLDLISTDPDYTGANISGKIVAIDSERFQMSFTPDYQMDAVQNGAILQLSKYTWKYDEANGDLVSNENDRLTYVGAETRYLLQ